MFTFKQSKMPCMRNSVSLETAITKFPPWPSQLESVHYDAAGPEAQPSIQHTIKQEVNHPNYYLYKIKKRFDNGRQQ